MVGRVNLLFSEGSGLLTGKLYCEVVGLSNDSPVGVHVGVHLLGAVALRMFATNCEFHIPVGNIPPSLYTAIVHREWE